MSILFVANNLSTPSHAWMRRFVDTLGPRITTLCDSSPEGPCEYNGRRVTLLSDDDPAVWRRALSRVHIPVDQSPRKTAAQKLSSVLECSRFSIVVVQFLNEAIRFSQTLSQAGLPVLVHCHGWDVTWDMHDHLTGCRRIHPTGYEQQARLLPERFHFLANSEETKRRLLEIGIPEARTHVLYFGVDHPVVCPTPPESGTVLFIGRLIDCKAPDLAIRAFELAASRGLASNLVIAGDGPLRTTCELLRARSSFAPRIELTGSVDQRRCEELRRQACIFTAHSCKGALTRQTEAFGVAFIEAMAGGLPIVTGRSGGIIETVRDGEDGILFEPGDVEGHADALLRLGADQHLRQQMGRSSWQRASDHFSPASEAQQIDAVLKRTEVLRERPAA